MSARGVIPGTEDEEFDLDLGDSHWLRYTSWAPDRTIEANRVRYDGIPDIEYCGALVPHRKADGAICMGHVHFDGEAVRKVFPGASIWQVQSQEPLTLSPSLLCCACGDHGFIRDGKWVRA